MTVRIATWREEKKLADNVKLRCCENFILGLGFARIGRTQSRCSHVPDPPIFHRRELLVRSEKLTLIATDRECCVQAGEMDSLPRFFHSHALWTRYSPLGTAPRSFTIEYAVQGLITICAACSSVIPSGSGHTYPSSRQTYSCHVPSPLLIPSDEMGITRCPLCSFVTPPPTWSSHHFIASVNLAIRANIEVTRIHLAESQHWTSWFQQMQEQVG
jgi:hypothetical protein